MSQLAQLMAVSVVAGGLALLAGTSPQRPVPKAPVETSVPVQPAEKIAAKKKVTPLPKLKAPGPIVQQERKARGKGMRNKRERTKRAGEKKERPKLKRTASLPSCARIQAAYNRMSVSERWAAYQTATPAQIAHGRQCLGL